MYIDTYYIFYFRMHIPSWHFNSHEQGHCLPGLHRQQDACGATGDGCQALESRWKVEPISRKLSLILGNLGFQKDHIRIISAQNGNKRLPSVTLRIKSGESKWTWEVHPRYVEILNQLVLQFPTCNVYHTISYDIIMAVLPSLCDSPCLQTTRLRKIIFMGVFIEFMHSNNRMAQVLSNRIAWHFASHIAKLPSSWFSTNGQEHLSVARAHHGGRWWWLWSWSVRSKRTSDLFEWKAWTGDFLRLRIHYHRWRISITGILGAWKLAVSRYVRDVLATVTKPKNMSIFLSQSGKSARSFFFIP